MVEVLKRRNGEYFEATVIFNDHFSMGIASLTEKEMNDLVETVKKINEEKGDKWYEL